MKCIICGDEIEGHGNNPSPVTEEGRCCDRCNLYTVVPARIKRAYESEEKAELRYRFLIWCDKANSDELEEAIHEKADMFEDIYQRGRIDAQKDILKRMNDTLTMVLKTEEK